MTMYVVFSQLQITLPTKFIPRWGHSGTSVSFDDDLVEIIMFGGCSNWPDEVITANDYIAVAETTIVQLSKGEAYLYVFHNSLFPST